MTKNTLITDDEIALIKDHFRRNKDYYAVGGIMLFTGVILGKKVRKPIKIDEAVILNEWFARQVKNGYHIYALNDLQHNLWQALYNNLEVRAKHTGETMEQLLKLYAEVNADTAKNW